MRLPTQSQTEDYFSTLGYELVCIQNGRWLLRGDRPLGGQDFASRLSLWSTWLRFVAVALHEERKHDAIVGYYVKASVADRAEVRKQLSAGLAGEPAPLLRHILRNAGSSRTDELPRDWKAKIARNLIGPLKGSRFTATIWDNLNEIDFLRPGRDPK